LLAALTLAVLERVHMSKGRGWFVVRRLGVVLSSLVAASMLVFVFLNVLPGSPAEVILGTQSTPASVAALTIQLGLNKPIWRQYLDWMGGLVHGNFGVSYISGQSIGHEIHQALLVTGPLVLLAMLIGLVIGVPLGLTGALYKGRWLGSVVGGLSQIGIAIPSVVAGILLTVGLSIKLHLFPSSGFPGWQDPWGSLRALVLPAFALGVVEGAILARYIRAAVMEQLRSDYLRTARSKGLRRSQALRRHGLRVAAIPVVTVLGLEIASLIVGAIVVENIFALPGVGMMLLNAVNNRDLIVVQDIAMVVVTAVLLINTLVDLSYQWLDPRLRGRR
jgi:peptide/nickel transport system permease protein